MMDMAMWKYILREASPSILVLSAKSELNTL